MLSFGLSAGVSARGAVFTIAALALLVWPSAARAQSDAVHLAPKTAATEAAVGEPSLTRSKPLVMNVDLVLVPVTVTDAKGHPVMGLERSSFSLFDGEKAQPIQYFSHEDTPISLGVILDLSKSMANKIDLAREAVAEFFQSANPQDDYFVVTFSDRPQLLADTTQSIGSIQEKLATALPQGRTALLDAIYLGIQKSHKSRYKRRALLIISDGGDNSSRYTEREIRDLVREADVEIYAVGIFDTFLKVFRSPEEAHGKRLLTDVTEATGGRTVTLDNAAELPKIASDISFELRSQYVLGYRPSDASRDGKWRKIHVRLNPSPDAASLQVYSKRGYYAPGE